MKFKSKKNYVLVLIGAIVISGGILWYSPVAGIVALFGSVVALQSMTPKEWKIGENADAGFSAVDSSDFGSSD